MLPRIARPLSRAAVLALACTVFGATGCKKKVEPPPPPPPPQPVEVRLQVTSVSPSQVNPDTETPGKVFGSAFVDGATVTFIGKTEIPGSEVRVLDANTIALMIPAMQGGTYDVRVNNPSGESSTLRAGLRVQALEIACRSVTVNFAFDDASLSSSARSTLDGYTGCFQSEANSIQIAGHADERGTVDYNVALGQRRAESVKSHLTRAGVSSGKISTTSYGEERPVDSGHNESAWSKNRRAEISASR